MPLLAVARTRFGLALAAALFAVLALPAFASAVKAPLTVVKTGTGQGTVTSSPSGISCGTTCSKATGSFLVETPITLTASPKVGSIFVGWSGCDAEPTPTTCEITVYEGEEPTIEAEFNEEKFFLFIEKPGTGQGTVTSSPAGINCGTSCEAEYLEGTKVILTASPAVGSFFEGWFGCDAEPSATKCEVTVKEEMTVEADFSEIEKFPLVLEKLGTGTGTVTSAPSGISCGTACSLAEAEYLEGTKVVLTASASVGSIFEGWTGCDAKPSATKCEVTIFGETIVEAEFTLSSKPKYSLAITTAGTGTGTVSCNGGACASSYDQGAKVTLTASAASGSGFSGFSGGGCSGTGSCIVTINADTTVTAVFNANPSPTCATNPSLCPAVPSKARAAGFARVKGGKAALKITCSGGACVGKLTLTARIKRNGKAKNVVIGKASFSLADGASAVLKVKLAGAAKQELGSGRSIKAKLTGTSIASSTVKLTPASK
ncbi:MAG: InlB B-repeat-containing protein [Solirubrobacterales bacterium]